MFSWMTPVAIVNIIVLSVHINGLVEDCSIFIVNALEIALNHRYVYMVKKND